MSEQIIRKPDFVLWDFPKLRDVIPEGPLFNLKCPECASSDIGLKPIDVNWRVQENNKDLGKALARFYDSMPTLNQAILQAISQQRGLLVLCFKCKHVNTVEAHIERTKVNRWLLKQEETNEESDSNTGTPFGNKEEHQTTNTV